uniref:G-protein coupled receptors family 1 profile domain-containing protein n=1 Tax=Loxodonta africana TaxID=9785 RepID=G3U3K0_LOXAF
SLWGCILQVFLVVFLACTDMVLLTVMSYDDYVVICLPLHNKSIMKKNVSIMMATSSWLSGGVSGILHTATTFSLPLRVSNLVYQLFPEILQLLRIFSSDNWSSCCHLLAEIFFSFVSIAISYIHIFSILMIPSTVGQFKAFSTSIPHLVFLFFLHAASVAYLKPSVDVSCVFNPLLSVLYTVVLPTLYSLKNKDMKAAL